jgi:glutamate racemase
MFPQVAFVGMEPAVKPAAVETRSGKVGVLATENTFSSSRYAQLMSRFAQDVEVIENPCRGLVSLIEAGDIASADTEALLHRVLDPMLAAGVDTLVLGCTHYPFVRSLIEGIVEENGSGIPVTIIDPAPAVAGQTARVLAKRHLLAVAGERGTVRLFTSARSQSLADLSEQFLSTRLTVEEVVWHNLRLTSA